MPRLGHLGAGEERHPPAVAIEQVYRRHQPRFLVDHAAQGGEYVVQSGAGRNQLEDMTLSRQKGPALRSVSDGRLGHRATSGSAVGASPLTIHLCRAGSMRIVLRTP